MKQIIICVFFIMNFSMFCSEYNIFELINLYEKNSVIAQINKLNEKTDETKLSEFEKNRWKKLSVELNPVTVKNNEEKKTKVYKDFQINYNGFYYNIKLDDKNEKSEVVFGYSKSVYDALFRTSFERKNIILNKELNNLKNKKELDIGKKEFIDLICDYKALQDSIKSYKVSMNELLKEKEILENKAEIDEASVYDLESNQNEIDYLKNVWDKSENDKKIVLDKISNLLKIELENDVEILDLDINDEIKKSSVDLEISESNIKILNNRENMEKTRFFQNVNVALKMDKVKTSDSVSLELIWTPLEDNLDKKLVRLETQIMEAEKSKIKNDMEFKNIENLAKFKFLKNEVIRIEKHYDVGKEKYEFVKNRFEKNLLSYYDFLKLKKEFLETENEYFKSKLELEKFWIKENL